MYDLDRARAMKFICETAPKCRECIIGVTVCNKLVGSYMPSDLTEDEILDIIFTKGGESND